MNNKILAAHIIRLFVWEVLKLNTSMDTVNGLIPIVPIEDEPKLADSGKPYIIYGFAEMEARKLDVNRQGIISFRIVAPTIAQLGEIANVINLTFETRDRSTEAVNRWSSSYPNDALIGIRFTSTKATYLERGEAAESEGGPVDTVINVTYEYITLQEVQLPEIVSGGLWT